MIFRDTSKKDLDVNKRSRFNLQSGTDALSSDEGDYIGYDYVGLFIISATGSSSPVGKYPANTAIYTEEHPNQVLWTDYSCWYYPYMNAPNILTDRKTYAILEIETIDTNNYMHKFKPGDPIVLQRHNIKRMFTVARVSLSQRGYVQLHLLNDRRYQTDLFTELDNFIREEGYTLSDGCAYVNCSRRIENFSNPPVLKDFYVDFNAYEYTDSYSARVAWEIDPSIKATKLRWRSVPRNEKITESISVSILSGGLYSGATVTASISGYPGNGAKVELTTTPVGATTWAITGATVTEIGGGYVSAPSVIIDKTYEISPGDISSSLLLQTEGRVDYVQVIDGGIGYTGATVYVSPFPGGTTAVGYAEIENYSIKNVVLTDRGYLFTDLTGLTSDVTIVSHGTGGTGANLRANIDIASQWVYENPLYTDKTKIVHGLKKGIPYEVQILCSDDENFVGECRYSNSINFIYF